MDNTFRAMAKDPDTGEIIDYFGGMEDLRNRVLMTPLQPSMMTLWEYLEE